MIRYARRVPFIVALAATAPVVAGDAPLDVAADAALAPPSREPSVYAEKEAQGERGGRDLTALRRRSAAIVSSAPACRWPCGALTWVTKADVIKGPSGKGVEGAAAGVVGGKIYVSHGFSGVDSAALRIYDPATDTWTFGKAASFARSELAGAAVAGRLYAFGGRTKLSAVEVYDEARAAWTRGAAMPTPRGGAGAAVIDGRVHVVGGRDGFGPRSGVALAAHEVYDPATDTWDTTRAPLPVAVGDVYATLALDGRMWVLGGWNQTGDVGTVQVYDPATDTWDTTRAALPTARSSAIAGVLGGNIVVIGGTDEDRVPLSVVEVYDPVSDSWCAGPAKPTPAAEMASSAATGDAIHAIGSGLFDVSGVVHEALVFSGRDVDPPQLDCPRDLTLECPAEAGLREAWLGSATATDNCTSAGVGAALETHREGCEPGTSTDTYVFTATDESNNRAACSAKVAVVDTTAPFLRAVPADEAVACDAVPDPANVSATDSCDGAPAVSLRERRVSGSCPQSYRLVRTWEAFDRCGNRATESQEIEVSDAEPPRLTPPPALALECVSPAGVPASDPRVAGWLLAATAADACGAVTRTAAPPFAFPWGCAPGRRTSVAFTATDECLNAASATADVVVADTTAPALDVPAPVTLECAAPGGVPDDDPRLAAWLAAVRSVDLCGPATVASAVPRLLPAGCGRGTTTRVEVAARDGCGNAVTKSTAVTVVDSRPPDLAGCGLEALLVAPPAPTSPSRPRSPASPPACTSRASFRVACGRATDACDRVSPALAAEIVARRHDVAGGTCVAVETRVKVACDEVVELRLVAPPCPAARPPKGAAATLSVTSAGRKVLTAESLSLEVQASDACGNASARCRMVADLCPRRREDCRAAVCGE